MGAPITPSNSFRAGAEVEKALVFEVAFDAVQRSTRHKSGVALRFPRINRIRVGQARARGG